MKRLYTRYCNEDYSTTPLAISARHGHLDVVKYLVQNGADIDDGNENRYDLCSLFILGKKLDS